MFQWLIIELFSPVCMSASIVSHKSLSSINSEVYLIKCTAKEETRKKRMERPTNVSYLSLSRSCCNMSCSPIWSLSYWNIWQFSSLTLMEALSKDCDVQIRSESQARVWRKEPEPLSFSDEHETQLWYWLIIVTKSMVLIS